jgi:hypothetical protein
MEKDEGEWEGFGGMSWEGCAGRRVEMVGMEGSGAHPMHTTFCRPCNWAGLSPSQLQHWSAVGSPNMQTFRPCMYPED